MVAKRQVAMKEQGNYILTLPRTRPFFHLSSAIEVNVIMFYRFTGW
jgi:hypothetical protein